MGEKDKYSEAEISKRRDEVVRRMANSPPQPLVNPRHHPAKKERSTDEIPKGRDREKS